MRILREGVALGGVMLIAGCQAIPPAAPPPPTLALPAPATPPLPALPTAPERPWDVADLTAGDWRYAREGRTRAATFGDVTSGDRFVILCDAGTQRLSLIVTSPPGQGEAPVTIRTSFGALAWRGSGTRSGAHGPTGLVITRPASDLGFDWIAFSRGRISIEPAGQARLIVPVWAEVSRVVEDCRDKG